MTTITCKRCGTDKPEADMIVRAGKPSKTCKACFAASFRKGEKAGKQKRTKPATRKEPAPAPAADEDLRTGPALSIAPGLGVEAWIENDCLQLSQGTDVVALSKTEAKVVFAQFEGWAA